MPELNFEPNGMTVLSLLPAIINFSLFLYAVIKLPRTRLTFGYVTFMLVLSVWQATESLARTAATKDVAELFAHASLFALIPVPIFGVRFILRLTGMTKFKSSSFYYIFYIVMPMIVALLLSTRTYEYIITESDFFNWNISPVSNPSTVAYLTWIGLAAFGMVAACWYAYFVRRSNSIDLLSLQLIAWGFTIPVILGVICEILLPILTDQSSFPVANVSTLCFSFATLYVLIRTDILRSIPKHEWRFILNHMSEGIIVLDSSFVLRYTNRKSHHILKTSQNQMREYDFFDNFKKAGVDLSALASLQETVVEIEITTGLGDKREIAARIRSYINRENNDREFLIIISDLHNLRKAENSAVQRTKQLTSLLYRTSHDLKNPAVCVQGLLSLYKEGTPEEKAKCVQLIEVSNNRILSILQSMETVTKFSQHKPVLAQFNIRDLVNQSINGITGVQNQLKIDNSINADLSLKTDSELLGFVFRELIANAMKFKRPLVANAQLKISYIQTPAAHIFSFMDNGIGIPNHHSGEMFGIFFRAHEHSGTGMGLYSVKWICDKLGYQLAYNRTPDGFTEFTIAIPNEEKSAEYYLQSVNSDSTVRAALSA